MHQVQPRSLQAQAALLVLVKGMAREYNTCFILLQDGLASQGFMLSHKVNQEEEVCLLGSSGVAL